MEPKQNGSGLGFERAPAQPGNFGEYSEPHEHAPGGDPERSAERRFEAVPSHIEVSSMQPAAPALPSPVVTATDDVAIDDSAVSGAPLVASDDDLIEKEWVDKAKKILLETKDDPYRREKEVSKLQIEYIRKRYGRIIGDSGD